MANLNKSSELKAYFETIKTRHEEISHFIYGSFEKLHQEYHSTIKKTEYALFVEWPQKQYSDQGGSVSVRLRQSISIVTNVNKDKYADQDTAVDKCQEILNDIIIRMRKEFFDNGWIFDINELGLADPIYALGIDNCVGVRVTFPVGDWVTTANDASKWSDL